MRLSMHTYMSSPMYMYMRLLMLCSHEYLGTCTCNYVYLHLYLLYCITANMDPLEETHWGSQDYWGVFREYDFTSLTGQV